jgi:hypothetical protein
MTNLPYLFALAVVLASCLGSIAVWAPRRITAKLAALLTFALFVPVAFAGWSDLLSRPKPVGFEWLKSTAGEAHVLAGTVREGDGIYVWLQIDGTPEPRAYQLPWNPQQAEQLQNALREAQSNGSGDVRMRQPFESSLDPREPKFYAAPQPSLPPKPMPQGGPERFAQSQA